MSKIILVAFVTAALYAQITPAQKTQYMRAACKGKMNSKGQCTVCLGSSEAGITDLVQAIPGSFTAPGSQKEVVVVTSSMECEPHANNFGGSVLLRFENGAWRNVYYAAGVTGTDFTVVRSASGRDYLVSQGAFTQAGEITSWLNFVTVSNGNFKDDSLLRVSDPGGTQCDPKGQVMNQGEIKKVQAASGAIHVQVQVVTSHQRGDKDGTCSQIPGSPKSTKLYDVEFVFQGEKMVAAPSSASTVAMLKKLFD